MKNFFKQIKNSTSSKNTTKNTMKTESMEKRKNNQSYYDIRKNNELEFPEEFGNQQNKREYYNTRGEEAQGIDQNREEGNNMNEYYNEKKEDGKGSQYREEQGMEAKNDTEPFSLRRLINQAQKIKENEQKSSKNINVNPNITVIKDNKKDKKDQKAYLNFIQTIKKANNSKKNKTKNIMGVDPKVKVVRAIEKIHKLNRIFHNTYKKPNREEEKEKLEITQKNVEENYNTNRVDNIYNNRLEDQKKGFTGFVLMKQNQGENIFQINLEGTLEEINKIFRMYNVEIGGVPVELVHTKPSAIRETDPFLSALRKKAMETENNKMEEDNSKLKEMQERVQKFKTQLRKAEDEDAHINLPSKRQSINNNKEEEDYNKNIQEKKRAKTIAFEEKEKDRERSYSRAMDRFKKRYKKDHSVEIRSKKSGKILELSKQLENVMGKANVSEINNVAEKERENNFEQLLENKPVVSKKSKKIKKFEL